MPRMRMAVRLLLPSVALAALLVSAFVWLGHSLAAPAVTTDKDDYFSNETATVTGSGFAASTLYDVPVIRPNGSIVKGDGSFTPG